MCAKKEFTLTINVTGKKIHDCYIDGEYIGDMYLLDEAIGDKNWVIVPVEDPKTKET